MKNAKCYIKGYPRPQFVRENWESLDGEWDFLFDDNNIGEKEKWFIQFPKSMKINVPFAYQTKKSGHNYSFLNRVFLKRLMAKFR